MLVKDTNDFGVHIMLKNGLLAASFLFFGTNLSGFKKVDSVPWEHPVSPYKSQFGQDKYAHEQFFKGQKGFFVEIGAADGEKCSNTYFFEKILGWNGLCIEPLPHLYARLCANRRCKCISCALGKAEGTRCFLWAKNELEGFSGFVDTYHPEHFILLQQVAKKLKVSADFTLLDVPVRKPMSVFEECHISKIDVLSLDTEGSELEILSGIDFSKITINVIVVENMRNIELIRNFLKNKGFLFVERLVIDDIFVRHGFAY